MNEQAVQERAYFYVCKGYGHDLDTNYYRAKKVQRILDLDKKHNFANKIVEEYGTSINYCHKCSYGMSALDCMNQNIYEGCFGIHTNGKQITELICDECLIGEYESTINDFPNIDEFTQFGWFLRRLIMIYKPEPNDNIVPDHHYDNTNEIQDMTEIECNLLVT
jgi:hypothetical protein